MSARRLVDAWAKAIAALAGVAYEDARGMTLVELRERVARRVRS